MYQEFDHLLEEQSPIESYIEWLDTMVDRCVVKVGKLELKGQPWSPQPNPDLCEHSANAESAVSCQVLSRHGSLELQGEDWSPCPEARGR